MTHGTTVRRGDSSSEAVAAGDRDAHKVKTVASRAGHAAADGLGLGTTGQDRRAAAGGDHGPASSEAQEPELTAATYQAALKLDQGWSWSGRRSSWEKRRPSSPKSVIPRRGLRVGGGGGMTVYPVTRMCRVLDLNREWLLPLAGAAGWATHRSAAGPAGVGPRPGAPVSGRP